MLSRLHGRSFMPLPSVAFVGAALVACGVQSVADRRADTSTAQLEVIGRDLAFDAPDQIPSGWTTISFRNEGAVDHFLVLERLPEGKTLESSRSEILPVFQDGMNLIRQGKTDEAMARFGTLPAWYQDVAFMGGPGFTSPGGTSTVTVRLDPGTYVLECYVKTPEGQFHSYLGMIDQIVVTDATAGGVEPEATSHMTLNNDGIEWDGQVAAGPQTIAVRFAEQQVHGNFLGNDVHLVRLEGGSHTDSIAAWINWSLPNGLTTPAPAHFLGGLHEMPVGTTGYLHVDLEPGRYAWIAEVDNPASKNMLHPFTVAAPDSEGR